MFPGQCFLAERLSEMCGMFWVEDLADLGGCKAYFVRLRMDPKHRDPDFKEEKGESVDALCQRSSVGTRRDACSLHLLLFFLQQGNSHPRVLFLLCPIGGSRAPTGSPNPASFFFKKNIFI